KPPEQPKPFPLFWLRTAALRQERSFTRKLCSTNLGGTEIKMPAFLALSWLYRDLSDGSDPSPGYFTS
ncbi:MAG TPA: hypothetical protein VNR65_04705, partial [Geobacterales bacterium]|nr:hypothetical protein [Geobacterales bacterium]